MCGPALNQANTGDRLLAGTLAAMLRDALDVERITYGSIDVDPRVAHDVRKIELINPRRQPWRLLWRAFRADVMVIAGAVCLHEHRRVMLKQTLLGWACRLGGGRVVVNAASIQPIRDPVCQLLYRAIRRSAGWFTVRDAASARYARILSGGQPARRSVDPGIICPVAATERVDAIVAAEGIAADRPILGIAPHLFVNQGRFHDPSYRGFQIEYKNFSDRVIDRYYTAMARVADRLTERGTVVFLPMCTRTPPGDDRVAAEWIQQRMAHADKSVCVRGDHHVDELAGLLARCHLLVASRLHGYAMAIAAGVPSVAIGFHPKIRGLAEEVGLADWVYPMRRLDARSICLTLDKILADLPAARLRVRSGVARAAARARRDFLCGVTGAPRCDAA
jgi:polysaccharide pyruvyl transferase WcaK-like protein